MRRDGLHPAEAACAYELIVMHINIMQGLHPVEAACTHQFIVMRINIMQGLHPAEAACTHKFIVMHINIMQGFLSAMGVLSKVSMLLFTACFMQIPFREHLLVQGIQVGWPDSTLFISHVRLSTFFSSQSLTGGESSLHDTV